MKVGELSNSLTSLTSCRNGENALIIRNFAADFRYHDGPRLHLSRFRETRIKQEIPMTRFFKLTTLCLFGWTVFSAGTMTVDATCAANDSTVVDGVVIEGAETAEFIIAAAKANSSPKLAAPVAKTIVQPAPVPHCEVPCGIYTDQLRFEQMLEDTKTITKAITSVNDIASGFQQGPPDAKTINQMTRWINNKESHATNIQHTVAQYFLTQRIKADNESYTKQLTAAHKVMVSAMKCKQDSDSATAKTLQESIYDLYRAYEGKEPTFHKEEKK